MLIIKCQYYINTCFLYRLKNCIVKFKPFPADKRIFNINNKGPRGVIPLKFLKII